MEVSLGGRLVSWERVEATVDTSRLDLVKMELI